MTSPLTHAPTQKLVSLLTNFYAVSSVFRDGEFQTVSCKCEKQSQKYIQILERLKIHIFSISQFLCHCVALCVLEILLGYSVGKQKLILMK